jgi:hypothetical protein
MVGGGSLTPCTKIDKDFVDKLGHASIAYNYDSDGSGCLHGTVQRKAVI